MTTLGVVAAPHHLAADIGAGLLQRGGNAFDAAVGVALAIGVTQPYHSGIGGGCNITYLTAGGEAGHINARGPAPAKLTREQLLDRDGAPDYALAQFGGLAVTVPSFVAGLAALHRGRGRLAWSEVCLAPQQLAAEGFLADFMLARAYTQPATAAKVASYSRGTPFAKPILEGQRIVQPRMAETLAAIARDSGAVYQGEIGRHLVAATRGAGGVLDLEDLADYHPKDTPLHEIRYRGWRVLAPGLPTVGSLQTLLALQILSRFEPETIVPGSARHLQLITAAVRATYDIRAGLEHPEAATEMTDDALAEHLATRVRRGWSPSSGDSEVSTDESCTSHFCIADSDGNVISQTQTVRDHFGSGVIDLETGVVLNDSVGDFSLQSGETTTQGIRYQGAYNLVAPGAEPASSQSPLIALDPETGDIIAAGAAGGPRIVSATVQVIMNQIDFGMNTQLAAAFPRVHSHGPITDVEPPLRKAGSVQEPGRQTGTPISLGIAQTIRRRSGIWEAGIDPRGPGGSVVVLRAGDRTVLRGYGHHDREVGEL